MVKVEIYSVSTIIIQMSFLNTPQIGLYLHF